MKPKLFFNWSSGKDSALALYNLLQKKEYSVELLFTTVSKENNRIAMHGLSEKMLQIQCKAIGIPLEIMYLPASDKMDTYTTLIEKHTLSLKEKGYTHTAFGDIFLEDLKTYREQQLLKVGLKAVFPLWEKNTKALIYEFLDLGFKSVIVAANAKWFGEEFVGSIITKALIDSLPEDVDPCGENGEFHTFCFDGPIFANTIQYKIGEKLKNSYPNPVEKGSEIEFWFCDLLV